MRCAALRQVQDGEREWERSFQSPLFPAFDEFHLPSFFKSAHLKSKDESLVHPLSS